MKFRLVLVVSLLLIAATVSPAAARDGMGPARGPMMGMAGMKASPPMAGSCITPADLLDLGDGLGLDPDQSDRLRGMDYSLTRQRILKGAAVKALELELDEIVTDPGFDVDNALEKLSEIEKARTELRSEVVKASAAAIGVLSSAQREKLRSLLRDRPPKKKKRPSRKPGAPDDEMKSRMKERMMMEMMDGEMP